MSEKSDIFSVMISDMEMLNILGNKEGKYCILQMVDEHDQKEITAEAEKVRALRKQQDWCIVPIKVEDWNTDLTPWKADPVFGNVPFGDGAMKTLDALRNEVLPALAKEEREFFLCGYSLAGLFALWAATRTDRFAGIIAASPSVWYPDWLSYAREHSTQSGKVYLSLGDREARTRNRVMATVADAIQEEEEILKKQGICCTLEWNPGNHFMDSDERCAKGIAWILK